MSPTDLDSGMRINRKMRLAPVRVTARQPIPTTGYRRATARRTFFLRQFPARSPHPNSKEQLMRKLKLDVGSLKVESFDAVEDPPVAPMAVEGQTFTTYGGWFCEIACP